MKCVKNPSKFIKVRKKIVKIMLQSCFWIHSISQVFQHFTFFETANSKKNRENYLSRTAKTILLTPQALNIVCTFSAVNPATVTLLICKIWSPNLRPPMEAGLPLATKATKMPLSIALTRKPTLPSPSLHNTTCK